MIRLLRLLIAFLIRRKNFISILQKSGPSLIKLGQVLSMRPDIVGDHMAKKLAKLQDNMKPASYHYIKKMIKKEFVDDIDSLFLSFDPSPVAAASVAQVHFAVTYSGEQVAVKILRPKIEKVFARDIRYFRFIVLFIGWWPSLKRLRLLDVIRTFEQWIKIETDLLLEAASADKLRESFKDRTDFFVPRIFWSLTRTRVLTMERVEGVHLLRGHYTLDKNIVLRIAIDVFLLQVFRDGFFHADMHPGNIFVTKNGLAVVDFGIMGHLNLKQRLFLAETLVGFLNKDYSRVSKIHFEMGFVPKTEKPELFELALRSIGESMFNKPLSDISIARLLADLFKTTVRFQMPVQPDLLLLQKTLLMAEGLSRLLDPQVNIWDLVKPYIEKWLIKNKTTVRITNVMNELCELLCNIPDSITSVWRPRRDSNTQPTD